MSASKKTPEAIIAESGNTFHCKVATAFRNAGWTVTISPYYVDSATDKAREFDLLCEKQITWKDTFQVQHEIWYQLFVECKYIKQATVFWFDLRDQGRASWWLSTMTPFDPENINHADQHYIQAGGHVAKLFASGNQEEQEPFYKALAQCLGAMTQGDWGKDGVPAKPGEPTRTVLRYPVIVHSDGCSIYRTEVVGGDSPPSPITANFVLEVNYAYLDRQGRTQQDYFLVDVVSFTRLFQFFAALEKEIAAAQFLLSVH